MDRQGDVVELRLSEIYLVRTSISLVLLTFVVLDSLLTVVVCCRGRSGGVAGDCAVKG